MKKWDIIDLWVEEDRKYLYPDETYPYKILVRMYGSRQALEVFVTDGDPNGWYPAGKRGLEIERQRRLPSAFRRILLAEEFEETFDVSFRHCWNAASGFQFNKFQKLIGLEAGNTINLRLLVAEKYGEEAAELLGNILRLEMVY